MFRKTIPLLWLLLLLPPQLSSAEDLVSEKKSPEISQDSVEIEGDNPVKEKIEKNKMHDVIGIR